VRIAHLSDSHLSIGPLSAGPAESLARAIGRALTLEPLPNCVVITGDLTEHGDPREYADLHAILDRCPIPVHLATGNHDKSEALRDEFAGTRYLAGGESTRYSVDYPEATVVVADSLVPGSPAGLLGAEQLTWIDDTLVLRPEFPALLAMHHPPVPVGIPFLDGMRLNDGPELAAMLRWHRNVARVLAGHIHRPVSVPFAGTLVTVAPSTYRQSSLRMHDAGAPGYLDEPTGFLLHLLNDALCVTHTVPVSHATAATAFA
jgi:3',5'-cyclic AMP phosphodiesterase CpdA